MTKKSKITPVRTVFLLRHYQSTNHQKIVPRKEYCRHRCNFRFSFCHLISQILNKLLLDNRRRPVADKISLRFHSGIPSGNFKYLDFVLNCQKLCSFDRVMVNYSII